MSYGSLALLVLAALIHATWNLMAKRAASAGLPFVFAYNLISLVAYAPWVIWVLAHGHFPWSLKVACCVFISGLIHLASSLSFQRGYQVADFSVVYPVARGTGPMLSAICAFLVLGETPTGLGLFGLLAVVAGIASITTQGDLSGFKKPAGLNGVWWGSAIGALIAAYTIVDTFGVKTLGIAPVVLIWFAAVMRFVLLAPFVARNPASNFELMQGKWRLAIEVGLLSMLPYILVLVAIEMEAPVSVVAPARELSMIFAALLGKVILSERVGLWRLIGCVALIAGVVSLSMS